MKLLFNDGQEITIQSINQGAGSLTILIAENISGITQEEMENLFSKTFATKVLTVDDTVYENYTILASITKYPGKLYDIRLEKEGMSTDELIAEAQAQAESASAKADENNLTIEMAIAELTTLIASIVTDPTALEGGPSNV